MTNPNFSLQEIASWAVNKQISLPTVQRGFVWKAYQIENLWDSLLRCYPVGAFVIADNSGVFEILDGQQRATAICLGFSKDTFRDSQDNIKVFIDLEEPNIEDNRKFIFRVITRSHPWGYRKNEPTKTLTSENIRRAMDLYDTTDPLTTDLIHFFPYEADFPLPFHFFLDEALDNSDLDTLYGKLINWQHWNKIYDRWKNKTHNTNFNDIELETVLKQKIANIFIAVIEMLDTDAGQKIPALYMNLNKFLKEEDNKNEETADEIENLFVRLNAGGTPLTGEELNYSILKAHLSRETQDIIENECKSLFRPSRFITIAFRLFQQTLKSDQQSDALSMRIKPKQFQRSILKQVHEFEHFLIEITTSKNYNNKTLLGYTEQVLAYDKTQSNYGLPFVIYSKIANGAPEVIFLLMYRIMIQKDLFFNNLTSDINQHKKTLGIITLFYWFGKGEKNKDHSKLLNNIWLSATTLDKERFWSSETIERAQINKSLLPFPFFYTDHQAIGMNKILSYKINEKFKILDKFESEEKQQEYRSFLQKIISNKDLILYAQRKFLEDYFNKKQYRLEDTSVPFDWDHISPNNFVHQRKKIPEILKQWYPSNGNFRAWPYSLNRMDSDNSPNIKLKPLCKSNYSDLNLYKTKQYKWKIFINSNTHLIKDINDVDIKLLEWSFCEPKWGTCAIKDIKKEWKPVTELIISRTFSIIEEWYEELLIENLKERIPFNFENIFLKDKLLPTPINNIEIDELFNIDSFLAWISNPFQIGKSELRFYFYYDKIENFSYFKENQLSFGIYESLGGGFINRMKNSNEFMDNISFTWIQNSFTLFSSNVTSITLLFTEVVNWLNQLDNYTNEEKQQLIENLKEIIQKQYFTI